MFKGFARTVLEVRLVTGILRLSGFLNLSTAIIIFHPLNQVRADEYST